LSGIFYFYTVRYLPLLLLSCFIFSCTVKKRTYRNGYFIDWVKSERSVSAKPARDTCEQIIKTPTEQIIASGNNELNLKKEIVIFPPDTCADLVCLKNGTDIPATIIELTEEKVRYKRCDNQGKGITETDKDKIIMVKYSNGVVDRFESEFKESFPVIHPKAAWSFVFSIFSLCFLALTSISAFFLFPFFIALVLAITLGHNALKKINQLPSEYKGRILVRISLVISYLEVALVIVALILFLSIFFKGTI
jgi:hypothetical protein